jgi:Carboxymuconolactone decarboxylase family
MQKAGSLTPEDVRMVLPDLDKYTRGTLQDNLWLRPGHAPRDRSLVTVSALITAGQVAQVPYHLNRAMDNGLTRSEANFSFENTVALVTGAGSRIGSETARAFAGAGATAALADVNEDAVRAATSPTRRRLPPWSSGRSPPSAARTMANSAPGGSHTRPGKEAPC